MFEENKIAKKENLRMLEEEKKKEEEAAQRQAELDLSGF